MQPVSSISSLFVHTVSKTFRPVRFHSGLGYSAAEIETKRHKLSTSIKNNRIKHNNRYVIGPPFHRCFLAAGQENYPYQIHSMALYLGFKARGSRERLGMAQTGIAARNSCPSDWHNQWMANCNLCRQGTKQEWRSYKRMLLDRIASFCFIVLLGSAPKYDIQFNKWPYVGVDFPGCVCVGVAFVGCFARKHVVDLTLQTYYFLYILSFQSTNIKKNSKLRYLRSKLIKYIKSCFIHKSSTFCDLMH